MELRWHELRFFAAATGADLYCYIREQPAAFEGEQGLSFRVGGFRHDRETATWTVTLALEVGRALWPEAKTSQQMNGGCYDTRDEATEIVMEAVTLWLRSLIDTVVPNP